MLAISLVFAFLSGSASSKEVLVTYSDSPIWTVGIGVGYADLTITLGETLSFSSYSSHDVALMHAPSTGSPWDQCSQSGIPAENFTSVWAPGDFTASSVTKKHYTPPTCGEFYLACSVAPHCMYGQRIKVIVKNADNAVCTSPCLNAACVTTASKVSKTLVHDVKPIANSGFWGQGPYEAITVDIGDSVLFRTGAGFHDVATVPSAADFDSCDMKDKAVVAEWTYMTTSPNPACNSSSVCCSGSACGATGQWVTYTFTASVAGDTYFVCSYGNGDHCKTGQKLRLTVRAPTTAAPTNSGSSNCAGQHTASVFLIMWALVASYVQCLRQ
jgi:hypothetical protein